MRKDNKEDLIEGSIPPPRLSKRWHKILTHKLEEKHEMESYTVELELRNAELEEENERLMARNKILEDCLKNAQSGDIVWGDKLEFESGSRMGEFLLPEGKNLEDIVKHLQSKMKHHGKRIRPSKR